MAQPLVSILIPVYNRETLIGPCIQSALEQTVTDIEIIVVDNASTDDTWEVCQSYAQKDSRVRIFRNAENLGPVRNWQRCITEARGVYGKIIFSDDLIHTQYLEKTVPMLKETTAFVFSTVCIGAEEWHGKDFYKYQNNTGIIPTTVYIKDCLFQRVLPVSPGCALFRLNDLQRNLCFEIPSPTISDFDKHGAGPDLLLFLLTATQYENIAFIDETLVFFRSHQGSITTSDKFGHLEKCYFQAKIWFAKTYTEEQYVDDLLIARWLLESRKGKKIISYEKFTAQYLTGGRKIQPYLLLKTIINSYKVKFKKILIAINMGVNSL